MDDPPLTDKANADDNGDDKMAGSSKSTGKASPSPPDTEAASDENGHCSEGHEGRVVPNSTATSEYTASREGPSRPETLQTRSISAPATRAINPMMIEPKTEDAISPSRPDTVKTRSTSALPIEPTTLATVHHGGGDSTSGTVAADYGEKEVSTKVPLPTNKILDEKPPRTKSAETPGAVRVAGPSRPDTLQTRSVSAPATKATIRRPDAEGPSRPETVKNRSTSAPPMEPTALAGVHAVPGDNVNAGNNDHHQHPRAPLPKKQQQQGQEHSNKKPKRSKSDDSTGTEPGVVMVPNNNNNSNISSNDPKDQIRKGLGRSGNPAVAVSLSSSDGNNKQQKSGNNHPARQFPSDKFGSRLSSDELSLLNNNEIQHNNDDADIDLGNNPIHEDSTKTEDDDGLLIQSHHSRASARASERGTTPTNNNNNSNGALEAYLVEATMVPNDDEEEEKEEEPEQASATQTSAEQEQPVVANAIKIDERGRQRTLCLMASAIAILVIALVAIILVVLLVNDDGGDAVQTESNTEPPQRIFDLPEFFADLPNSTMQSLKDPESAQSQALEWLYGHPDYDTMQTWRKIQLFALATIYHAMQERAIHSLVGSEGDEWMLYDVEECLWLDNVAEDDCDDGRVTKLQLDDLGLDGTIPVEVSLLTDLIIFEPKENKLYGTLPSELGLLTKLTKLHLKKCDFSGFIPTELGELTYLKFLSLRDNKFLGVVPSELGRLTYLEELQLYGNDFLRGSVPSEFGQLSRLTKLGIYETFLTGTIPQSLCEAPGWNVTEGKMMTFECCCVECPCDAATDEDIVCACTV